MEAINKITDICLEFTIINMLDQACIDSYNEINKNREYNFITQLLIDEPTIKEVIYHYESGKIIMKTYTDKQSVSYFTSINEIADSINGNDLINFIDSIKSFDKNSNGSSIAPTTN